MSNRDSFIFYRSYAEALEGLPDKNKLAIINAIISKSLNFEEPKLEGIEKNLFALIRPQIEANNKKYINGCRGAEYGSLGGAPVGNSNAKKQPQNNPKTTRNVNVNDNVNSNENEFIKPSLEEVKQYCVERKNNIDAEQFIDHYESNGWVVGKNKNKMQDWKASVRTWERNRKQEVMQRKEIKNNGEKVQYLRKTI